MTRPPDLSSLLHRALPQTDDLLVVDAIGPLNLVTPSPPSIKVTLTILADGLPDLAQRQPRRQRVVDLHVADLMALGPGTLIRRQRPERHPKGFLTPLRVRLDMATSDLTTFQDLGAVFGPQGAYPSFAAWPMLKSLRCLRFPTSPGTVLIPCLDAWRFTLATSSTLLTLSTRPECHAIFSQARADSRLETADGRSLPLPLPPLEDDSTALAARQALIRSSTLHLGVPPGFTTHELPFLAWCLTDDLAFQAVTRFYSSIVSSRSPARSSGPPSGPPEFRFPFRGTVDFSLRGTWLTVQGRPHFLTHHIDTCRADIAMPQHLTHTLTGDDAPALATSDDETPQQRTRAPRLAPQAETDSLQPPTSRLTTLHFGLRRSRFPHLQGLELTSRLPPAGSSPSTHLTGAAEAAQVLSLGDAEPGGEHRRKLKLEEQTVTPPPLPEQRAVHYKEQFCDLLGVCQELKHLGIQFEFMPLGERVEGDPTTLIPATLGTAATWVGQGITARRALIARLSYRGEVAYALEWERIKPKEYGRLLLCTIDPSHAWQNVLLHLLEECAQQRGVWPETAGNRTTISLFRISHRAPYATLMSRVIYQTLVALQWPLPIMTDTA